MLNPAYRQHLRRLIPVLLLAPLFASPAWATMQDGSGRTHDRPADSLSAVRIAQAAIADSEVEQLQLTLNALGYDVGKADGVMGSRTRTALLAFQNAYGVPQTGLLDDPTRRALSRAQTGAMERLAPIEEMDAPRAVQAYHHNLLEGEIADVQSRLNSAGYDAGSASGVVTDQTREALASFQRDENLPVTGLVGPETWEALQSIGIRPDETKSGIDF